MPGVQPSAGARQTDKGPFPEHTGWKGMLGGDKEVLDNDRFWQMYWDPAGGKCSVCVFCTRCCDREGLPEAPTLAITTAWCRVLQGKNQGKAGSQLWLNESAASLCKQTGIRLAHA